MNQPVSVVIPVYNGARFLAETVDCVLNQVGVDVDLIVVNDGSTDDTMSVLDRYAGRLRTLHREHRGIPFTRNDGLRLATAPWIAFVDADDLWRPSKLQRQLEHMSRNPDADGCVTHAQNFFESETAIRHPRLDEPVPGFSLSSLLGKRSLFDRLGPFDESVKTSDTMDWFIRARELGARIDLLPDVLVRRRLHDANTSRVHSAVAKDELVDAVKRALDRRRASGADRSNPA